MGVGVLYVDTWKVPQYSAVLFLVPCNRSHIISDTILIGFVFLHVLNTPISVPAGVVEGVPNSVSLLMVRGRTRAMAANVLDICLVDPPRLVDS